MKHDAPAADTEQRRAIVALLLRQAGDPTRPEGRWLMLQPAHIVGQADLRLHARVHLHMLRLAWLQRDAAECAGQLLRLALLPLGHATGRLPAGNTGRSDVGAFDPMPLSPALSRVIAQARRDASDTRAP